MLLATYISTVLTGALIRPFNAGVMALQYYDQRFRKEGLDIQLLNQSLQRQGRGDRASCRPRPGALFSRPRHRPATGCARSSPGRTTRSPSLERFTRWFNELLDGLLGRDGAAAG